LLLSNLLEARAVILAKFSKLHKFLEGLLKLNLIYLNMDKLVLKEDLARFKWSIIKWMFIFWVGQLAATIAIAKLFFHS